ncbi:hypothetical protein PHYSODRAFT_338716, partial [Phytophthora sojae]
MPEFCFQNPPSVVSEPGGVLRAGKKIVTREGRMEPVPPRALETSEIPGIVADYRSAAENALKAGFDG